VFVELAARRAALGVDVASAKFLAGRDIEDPGREEEMLASMADGLNAAGDSRGTGLASFLDQIERKGRVGTRGRHGPAARRSLSSPEAPSSEGLIRLPRMARKGSL
jgi:hypothetical protein